MIRPILACDDPHKTTQIFIGAGRYLDFSQSPKSGDPLVGVSLFNNSVFLGISDGYVNETDKPYIGCEIEFYMKAPQEYYNDIYNQHRSLGPTVITFQPWGEHAFVVQIGQF